MRPKKTVTACEHCGTQIDLQSPPLSQYYRRGRIDISEPATVLLDPDKPSQVHSASIAGLYCDAECLMAHIVNLRKGVPVCA
jgi:hypothetical protein